mmetsp:Transcript_16147/g.41805  ORF Transcript_16147/g.41805 Transcript_16147/m.41805 type:complete len:327 (+) Transcript_16147:913-1893(+)
MATRASGSTPMHARRRSKAHSRLRVLGSANGGLDGAKGEPADAPGFSPPTGARARIATRTPASVHSPNTPSASAAPTTPAQARDRCAPRPPCLAMSPPSPLSAAARRKERGGGWASPASAEGGGMPCSTSGSTSVSTQSEAAVARLVPRAALAPGAGAPSMMLPLSSSSLLELRTVPRSASLAGSRGVANSQRVPSAYATVVTVRPKASGGETASASAGDRARRVRMLALVRRSRRSHHLTEPSPPALTSTCSPARASAITHRACAPSTTARHSPVRRSHSLIDLSQLPDTSRPRALRTRSERTVPRWPWRTWTSRPVRKSHTRTH